MLFGALFLVFIVLEVTHVPAETEDGTICYMLKGGNALEKHISRIACGDLENGNDTFKANHSTVFKVFESREMVSLSALMDWANKAV